MSRDIKLQMPILVMVLFGNLFNFETTSPVSTDILPIMNVEFNFVFETREKTTIVGGTLLQCSEPSCLTPDPEGATDEVELECGSASCKFSSYFSSDYGRLTIRFSDGIVRESNPFPMHLFFSRYRVIVREANLRVRLLPRWAEWMAWGSEVIPLLGLIEGSITIVALIFTALFARRARRDPLSYRADRRLFILFWILVSMPLLLSLLLTPAPLLSLAIECVVALLYAVIRRRPKFETITFVALANALTLPGLWILVALFSGLRMYQLLLLEVLIWLVEAAALYAVQLREIDLKEAAVLSLVVNGASLLFGWILYL